MKEARFCLQLLDRIREDGIHAELYPDAAKMKNKWVTRMQKKIPFVALDRNRKWKINEITVKNMSSGEQSKVTMDELCIYLNELLVLVVGY